MAAFDEVYLVEEKNEVHYYASDDAYAYCHNPAATDDFFNCRIVQIVRFRENYKLVRGKRVNNCRDCREMLDDFNKHGRRTLKKCPPSVLIFVQKTNEIQTCQNNA
jgi:hypothetical protein